MERRIAPSLGIEAAIEAVLLDGLDDPDRLGELGRLGARLVIQRAVEEEVAAFLSRARYARTPEAAGSRNGHRPRRIQTAEGEITIAMPQVRGSLTRFVSSGIPDTRSIVRTRPLEALVIGAYVRGLSDRDIESLAREAGLGHDQPDEREHDLSRAQGSLPQPSEPGASATSGSWRCSWTRSTCRSAQRGPRRASSSPGASRPTASGSCSMSVSVNGSGPRTGLISG